MKLLGRIQNGVVVLDGSPSLSEWATVTVLVGSPLVIRSAENQRRVEFPLFP